MKNGVGIVRASRSIHLHHDSSVSSKAMVCIETKSPVFLAAVSERIAAIINQGNTQGAKG